MNQKEQDRLTSVEIDTKMIKSELDVIKNNHLHHLAADIDKMDKKIDRFDMRLWAIIFMIVSLLASTLLSDIF